MAKQLDVVPFGATYSRAAGISFKPCLSACFAHQHKCCSSLFMPPDAYLFPTAMQDGQAA
jgi:hypothetical protein